MMRVSAILIIFALCVSIKSEEECPVKYRRLSREHSFCLPPNTECAFISKGIEDEAEIIEILEAHNEFRSIVAMGEETRAGGLPSAADMLEMTWDEELADISQKWAEQCHYKHDCSACRGSPSFSVGQNIAYSPYPCEDGACKPYALYAHIPPEWYRVIKVFYDEVVDFDKNTIKSTNITGEKLIGHFTQLVWASTYKIGCGRSLYAEDGVAKMFYVCNYGPSGNADDFPLYEEGPPCSNCPINSCCDDTCPEGESYPGLCQLTSTPPEYPTLIKQTYLYQCNFKEGDPNCEFSSEGAGKWELTETVGGTFLSVVGEENQSTLAHFHSTIKVKRGTCMNLFLRRGPNAAGEKDDSKQQVIFEQNGKRFPPAEVWSYLFPEMMVFPVEMDYEGDIKFSIKFIVPAGAPPQYLEISRIEITEETCFPDNKY